MTSVITKKLIIINLPFFICPICWFGLGSWTLGANKKKNLFEESFCWNLVVFSLSCPCTMGGGWLQSSISLFNSYKFSILRLLVKTWGCMMETWYFFIFSKPVLPPCGYSWESWIVVYAHIYIFFPLEKHSSLFYLSKIKFDQDIDPKVMENIVKHGRKSFFLFIFLGRGLALQ